MNNQLIIERKIANLETDKKDKQGHLKYLDRLLTASFILTFLLYLAFSLSLYVGDVFHLQTIIESFMGGSFGLLFFALISALLAYVLAGTKHAAYKHFSMFHTVKIILLLMVFTGILAEVFNSSGVQDSKSRTINNSNKEYNALVDSGGSSDININSGLTDKIAYAEKVLARCKVNLAAGKEKHCRGDQAKLDALKNSEQTLIDAQIKASNSNQADKFKRLDEIKNDSYNPVIRSLSKTLGIDIAAAISLLMLIFAGLFEAMHYYLSVMRRDTLKAIEGIQAALDRLEVDLINENQYSNYANNNEVSDYPEENKTRWNNENNAVAQRQNFVGFINPDKRVSPQATQATSKAIEPRTVHNATRETTTRNTSDSVSHYEMLRELIVNGDLSVTYRPIKAWMKRENIGTSDRNRQDLTMEYLDKMFDEGILVLNPANNGKGINKAKYILNKGA